MKPGELVPGNYELNLESIDDNGSVKTVLRKDMITLRVVWQFVRDNNNIPSMLEV